MTRALSLFAGVLAAIMAIRGIDYVTGNSYTSGPIGDDNLHMPIWWGSACILTAIAVFYSVWRRKAEALKNSALVAFAIYVMFAVQTYDMRMLPIPWPPEDTRVVGDHLGFAVLWIGVAFTVWWREGKFRRRAEILEEKEAI